MGVISLCERRAAREWGRVTQPRTTSRARVRAPDGARAISQANHTTGLWRFYKLPFPEGAFSHLDRAGRAYLWLQGRPIPAAGDLEQQAFPAHRGDQLDSDRVPLQSS